MMLDSSLIGDEANERQAVTKNDHDEKRQGYDDEEHVNGTATINGMIYYRIDMNDNGLLMLVWSVKWQSDFIRRAFHLMLVVE